MLEYICVKNLALIEECEISFDRGLNVLTGETGAGKSVLLGSVNLALGARADKDMIRTGAEEAMVTLSFSADEDLKKLLSDNDLPVDDCIIISRKITPSKSIFKINGEIVNAKTVKDIAESLIDIHGQHEHQSLLNNSRQLEMLDAYGGEELAALKSEVADKYSELTRISAELSELEGKRAGLDREIGLLKYEIGEIEEAGLTPDEDEELEEKYRLMQSSEKLLGLLNEALNCVSSDNGESAGNLISRASQCMNRAGVLNEGLSGIADKLNDAEALLGDAALEISGFLDRLDYSDEEFAETEERLNLINSLKNRFGRTIADVIKYAEDKSAELEKLENFDRFYNETVEKEKKARRAYEDAASRLSKVRVKTADAFSGKLKEELLKLSFDNVVFNAEIRSDSERVSKLGFDSVEFMISTNLGEPVKPMKNVSSGGELSRIMLAIKTILAKEDEIDSLIFDEIDAGISGRTAWNVGSKLHELSKDHQVILITHLAQIAAFADTHFAITKTSSDSRTVSDISKLSRDGEIAELARLIGTDEPGEVTLENARELKERADAEK